MCGPVFLVKILLFLNENLTGDMYLQMLMFVVEPFILELIENNTDNFEVIILRKNFSTAVRVYLDEQYPNRWICRRGTIAWPPMLLL